MLFVEGRFGSGAGKFVSVCQFANCNAICKGKRLETLLTFLLFVSFGPAAYAQEPSTGTVCSIRGFAHETWTEASQSGHGLKAVPRSAVRPSNLKWELPILAVTGVLIAKVDRPVDNRIQSLSLQQTAGRWSNIGLGIEIGSAALAYGIGCRKHHSYLRDTGFKALAAMGAAGTVDLALKLAFDRQFPFKPGSTGKFWGGGRAFPSGHSATSFAFAGEHMRLQLESASHATRRKSTTRRTSS